MADAAFRSRLMELGATDSPQLLRLVGLAGTLYAVIGCVTTGLHMVQERDRQARSGRVVKVEVPAGPTGSVSAADFRRRTEGNGS